MLNLGGLSSNNSVIIRTDNIGIKTEIKNGKMNSSIIKYKATIKNKNISIINKVPLLRTFNFLFEEFLEANRITKFLYYIVFFIFILAFIFKPSIFISDWLDLSPSFKNVILSSFSYIVIMFSLLLFKVLPISKFHGAEHKVIETYNKGIPVNLNNTIGTSRLSYSCGSNLFILFIMFTFIFSYFLGFNLFTFLLSWAVGLEIFQLQHTKFKKLLKPLFFIPMIIQFSFLTSEPTDKEMKVAINSFNELIRIVNQQKD